MNPFRFLIFLLVLSISLGGFVYGCGDDDDDDDDNGNEDDDDESAGETPCDAKCYSAVLENTYTCEKNQAQCMGGCGEDNDGCQSSCETDWQACMEGIMTTARECAGECNSCLTVFYDCYGQAYEAYNDCVLACENDQDCIDQCYDDQLPEWAACDTAFQDCASWYDPVCHGNCEQQRATCDEACKEESSWENQWECYDECDNQAANCRVECI
jgi:hypothetical protein